MFELIDHYEDLIIKYINTNKIENNKQECIEEAIAIVFENLGKADNMQNILYQRLDKYRALNISNSIMCK